MSNIERSQTRPITMETNINPHCKGSVIINCGQTKVHITATVDESVPRWMKGQGSGWLTAEYNMLPGSTNTRFSRERKKVSGRTQEIQRLIGRSLRACIDLKKLGERSITIDCDVLVADGGTRTTSISGAYVALALCIKNLIKEGLIKENPLTNKIAAISVGINKNGKIISDLNYEEDSTCNTDMNIVMNDEGKFIEVQGTAEGKAFSFEELNDLTKTAHQSINDIFKIQTEIINKA